MSPPPKFEVKGKAIHIQMMVQDRQNNLIGQAGRTTGIDITHIIGLVFIRIKSNRSFDGKINLFVLISYLRQLMSSMYITYPFPLACKVRHMDTPHYQRSDKQQNILKCSFSNQLNRFREIADQISEQQQAELQQLREKQHEEIDHLTSKQESLHLSEYTKDLT